MPEWINLNPLHSLIDTFQRRRGLTTTDAWHASLAVSGQSPLLRECQTLAIKLDYHRIDSAIICPDSTLAVVARQQLGNEACDVLLSRPGHGIFPELVVVHENVRVDTIRVPPGTVTAPFLIGRRTTSKELFPSWASWNGRTINLPNEDIWSPVEPKDRVAAEIIDGDACIVVRTAVSIAHNDGMRVMRYSTRDAALATEHIEPVPPRQHVQEQFHRPRRELDRRDRDLMRDLPQLREPVPPKPDDKVYRLFDGKHWWTLTQDTTDRSLTVLHRDGDDEMTINTIVGAPSSWSHVWSNDEFLFVAPQSDDRKLARTTVVARETNEHATDNLVGHPHRVGNGFVIETKVGEHRQKEFAWFNSGPVTTHPLYGRLQDLTLATDGSTLYGCHWITDTVFLSRYS